MKLIYPNFKQIPKSIEVIQQIDENRLEIINKDFVQIENFEQNSCVALLEYVKFYEICDIPILIHQCYDPVTNFKETSTHYEFEEFDYNYYVPKHGRPIFYKFVE